MFASLLIEARTSVNRTLDHVDGLAVVAKSLLRGTRDEMHPDAPPFPHLRDAEVALDAHRDAIQRARASMKGPVE
ncbi:MAG TPA: hypothetical protein VFZ00_28400 [Solirubrobacter sp.]|nr:hypothetical protein [Solirubrobacter sp.]